MIGIDGFYGPVPFLDSHKLTIPTESGAIAVKGNKVLLLCDVSHFSAVCSTDLTLLAPLSRYMFIRHIELRKRRPGMVNGPAAFDRLFAAFEHQAGRPAETAGAKLDCAGCCLRE